eukprot:scaffold2637_cov270-Ochromonas_danica.AAC.2
MRCSGAEGPTCKSIQQMSVTRGSSCCRFRKPTSARLMVCCWSASTGEEVAGRPRPSASRPERARRCSRRRALPSSLMAEEHDEDDDDDDACCCCITSGGALRCVTLLRLEGENPLIDASSPKSSQQRSRVKEVIATPSRLPYTLYYMNRIIQLLDLRGSDRQRTGGLKIAFEAKRKRSRSKLSLGFKSYFKTTCPLSVRASEIKQLNDSILWMVKGDYITVTGGKGIGKTCLIDTTLNRHLGVTESGADKDLIIDQALRALTGSQLDFFKPVGSARRLLFFYSFLFKLSPIVVIRVPERESSEPYAQVTSAVNQVKNHILSVLSIALNKIVLNSSSNTKAIVNVLREKKVTKIPKAELKAMGFLLDYPNKVFREVDTADDSYIVPSSSPAVSLIISEIVQNDGVGVRELRDKLFKTT